MYISKTMIYGGVEMNYCFLFNDFLVQYKNTNDIKTSIKNYIYNNYNTLKDIYFEPKKIEKDKIEKIIKSRDYQKVLLDTIKIKNNQFIRAFFGRF